MPISGQETDQADHAADSRRLASDARTCMTLAPHRPKAAKSTQEPLAERVIAGDKRALARAISLVENRDPKGDRLVAETSSAHRPGRGSLASRGRRASARAP